MVRICEFAKKLASIKEVREEIKKIVFRKDNEIFLKRINHKNDSEKSLLRNIIVLFESDEVDNTYIKVLDRRGKFGKKSPKKYFFMKHNIKELKKKYYSDSDIEIESDIFDINCNANIKNNIIVEFKLNKFEYTDIIQIVLYNIINPIKNFECVVFNPYSGYARVGDLSYLYDKINLILNKTLFINFDNYKCNLRNGIEDVNVGNEAVMEYNRKYFSEIIDNYGENGFLIVVDYSKYTEQNIYDKAIIDRYSFYDNLLCFY